VHSKGGEGSPELRKEELGRLSANGKKVGTTEAKTVIMMNGETMEKESQQNESRGLLMRYKAAKGGGGDDG